MLFLFGVRSRWPRLPLYSSRSLAAGGLDTTVHAQAQSMHELLYAFTPACQHACGLPYLPGLIDIDGSESKDRAYYCST